MSPRRWQGSNSGSGLETSTKGLTQPRDIFRMRQRKRHPVKPGADKGLSPACMLHPAPRKPMWFSNEYYICFAKPQTTPPCLQHVTGTSGKSPSINPLLAPASGGGSFRVLPGADAVPAPRSMVCARRLCFVFCSLHPARPPGTGDVAVLAINVQPCVS